MQTEYLDLLSEPVQQFILEVEKSAGVYINVIPDIKLNEGGPAGQGNLEINIKALSIQLFVPTNGYFPDGAVRHEVLHMQRFLIERVPKLVLAENARWDKGISNQLVNLDNAIEHLLIVPVELQLHPERRQHWEAMMQDICSALQNIPEANRRLAVFLHWTFLRHVLPNSSSVEIMSNFARDNALLEMADNFADQFIAAVASKDELVRLLFHNFPELPKNRAALEYINSNMGTCQKQIP